MRKHIHFIKELANATDAYLNENSNKSLKPTPKSGVA